MNERLPQHVAGFILGMGLGAALAILFAPQSGEETRQYLIDGATDTIDDAVAMGRKLRRRARRAVNDMAGSLMEATEAGQEAHRKAKTA